jgi:hypothetical protein
MYTYRMSACLSSPSIYIYIDLHCHLSIYLLTRLFIYQFIYLLTFLHGCYIYAIAPDFNGNITEICHVLMILVLTKPILSVS